MDQNKHNKYNPRVPPLGTGTGSGAARLGSAGGAPASQEAPGEGLLEAVTLLMAQGASPEVRDAEGNTPMSLAEEGKHMGCLRMMRIYQETGGQAGGMPNMGGAGGPSAPEAGVDDLD